MYRKLMFLISLVALLGLVNVASAIDWIGAGSFCDPNNWEGGVVPGPGDEAWIDCQDGQGDIVIDCPVTVDSLRGPAMEGDCNQVMDIVSGNIVCNTWRAVYEGDKVGIVNMTGGTLTTLEDGEDSCRLSDDGGDGTYGYYNFGGNAVLNVGGKLRSGDNGGNIFITITDDAVVNVDEYLRIGDDGGGKLTVSGNARLNIGLDEEAEGYLEIGVRKCSAEIEVSDNAQIWVREDVHIGKPGDFGRKEPNLTAVMTMSGGTINCENFLVGVEKHEDATPETKAFLTLAGGTIIVRDELKIGTDDGNGEVHLNGGTISCNSFDIGTGTMDIDGGTLIINGDALAHVFDLVIAGKLTGKGTAQGVKADYNVTNPGKTTVVGVEADPHKAWLPSPPDGGTKVPAPETPLILKWQAGDTVGLYGRHQVYFGTDYDAVANADLGSDEYRGDTLATVLEWNITADYGPLELWKTYYWRIDELGQDWVIRKGDVWSFTTGCEAIPGDINQDCQVNFLDYADVASTWQQQQFWP